MDKYKCSCCGGNINRATMICEYCGTRYKEERESVIKIETFRNPVRTLASRVAMDRYFLTKSPEEASEYAIRTLARQFAECIAPYMDIQCSLDRLTDHAVLDAQIKVVEPINKPMDALGKLRGAV